jgi:hypothetical protein
MGPSFFEEVRRVVPSEDWTGTSSARYAKGMMAAKRPVNRAWYVPRFEGVITTRIGPRCPVDSLRHSPFQVPVGFCPWTTVGSWACRLYEKLEKEAACRETKPRARRVISTSSCTVKAGPAAAGVINPADCRHSANLVLNSKASRSAVLVPTPEVRDRARVLPPTPAQSHTTRQD